MNKIILRDTIVEKNKIEYIYEIEGKIKNIFKNRRKYSIEYDFNLNDIPLSIINIPFVLNMLPLCYLYDILLEVKTIDRNFYDCLDKIKNGYIKMYSNVKFGGNLKFNNIESNKYTKQSRVGLFFSGGLDATSTLATHYIEKPLLINLQGADVSLDYAKELYEIKKSLSNIAEEYELDITFVKSEFRKVIKEKKVTKDFDKIVHDNFWHAFQHGVSIIGHAAPIAFKYDLKLIYIAASYTKETLRPCASDPTIDNMVSLSKTSIFHDGFELSRNMKSSNVIDFLKKTNKKINIRVCLDDYRSENCCKCEKCYRTILNFASNGFEPSKVGFKLTDHDYKRMKENVLNNIIFSDSCITLWREIQNNFKKNIQLKNDKRFKWIYDLELNEINKKNN